jgi:hypothetical protein
MYTLGQNWYLIPIIKIVIFIGVRKVYYNYQEFMIAAAGSCTLLVVPESQHRLRN